MYMKAFMEVSSDRCAVGNLVVHAMDGEYILQAKAACIWARLILTSALCNQITQFH